LARRGVLFLVVAFRAPRLFVILADFAIYAHYNKQPKLGQ